MKNDSLIYIPSLQIREAVAKQDLWVPRPSECKAADFLNTFRHGVSMVGAYFTLCSSKQALPTQEEYVPFSLNCHEDAIRTLSKEQLDAMKARLARAYNTYVAEHSLLSLCIESGEFYDCYKTEELNTHSSVDLIVKLKETSNPIGFAIHISTPEAKKWQPIKDGRQKARGKRWQWTLLHIHAEFWRMEKVGNIHLFWYFYGANMVLGTIRQINLRENPVFKEFNARFLLATQCYMPEVALDLLRQCREDIFYEGFEYAQYKWAEFIEIPKAGTCPVCGSSDWRYRPASELGGPGGRLCGQCHPNPDKEPK